MPCQCPANKAKQEEAARITEIRKSEACIKAIGSAEGTGRLVGTSVGAAAVDQKKGTFLNNLKMILRNKSMKYFINWNNKDFRKKSYISGFIHSYHISALERP